MCSSDAFNPARSASHRLCSRERDAAATASTPLGATCSSMVFVREESRHTRRAEAGGEPTRDSVRATRRATKVGRGTRPLRSALCRARPLPSDAFSRGRGLWPSLSKRKNLSILSHKHSQDIDREEREKEAVRRGRNTHSGRLCNVRENTAPPLSINSPTQCDSEGCLPPGSSTRSSPTLTRASMPPCSCARKGARAAKPKSRAPYSSSKVCL